jgi:hypothetical protein
VNFFVGAVNFFVGALNFFVCCTMGFTHR